MCRSWRIAPVTCTLSCWKMVDDKEGAWLPSSYHIPNTLDVWVSVFLTLQQPWNMVSSEELGPWNTQQRYLGFELMKSLKPKVTMNEIFKSVSFMATYQKVYKDVNENISQKVVGGRSGWGMHEGRWEFTPCLLLPVTITLQALSLVEKAEPVVQSSLHTTLEGPKEYVNASWM